MTPLVTDIFRKTLWYHPAKIFGFPGPVSIVVNSEVAHHQTFDPQIVDVPVTGGPDLESIVPVFSRANPCPVDKESSVLFAARLRGIDPSDFPRKAQPADGFVNIPYPEAIALNRLISAIAYGIHGDEQAIGYAHVRTNIVKTCRFMVSQVKFGPEGVVHNYGIPKLSNFEQDLLERAVAMLSSKEQMAAEYLEYYLSKRRDILPRFKQQEVDEYLEKKKTLMKC
ncbi:hypothetical protein WA026_010813 [Henosepilachna vigintioctopunctata]|uniref:Uncharacterized protein n=1 Tax=Henosepilachna vigintioctopunctata TaxID=420089 RepID=A0AAW1UZC2_9CUCU